MTLSWRCSRQNDVSEYGADHVRFDESTSTFQIDADKIMLAIRDKQSLFLEGDGLRQDPDAIPGTDGYPGRSDHSF